MYGRFQKVRCQSRATSRLSGGLAKTAGRILYLWCCCGPRAPSFGALGFGQRAFQPLVALLPLGVTS
eukprot:7293784-Pyramimonas_sp.AAC.1